MKGVFSDLKTQEIKHICDHSENESLPVFQDPLLHLPQNLTHTVKNPNRRSGFYRGS